MAAGADPSQLAAEDAEEAEMWATFIRDRELAARNRLIVHYLPLCRMVAATTYARRGGLQVEFLDYMQYATLGLIEAVQRFDPSIGVRFASYARPRIRGSILNNLEALSEEYSQVSLRKRVEHDRIESLSQPDAGPENKRRKHDLLSSLAGLAIGLALADLLEGSGMLVREDDERSHRQEFYHRAEQKQLRETIASLVGALPEQERRVVEFHYYQGLDFVEIARIFGLSKGRISQIHRQALQLVREAYESLGSFDLEL